MNTLQSENFDDPDNEGSNNFSSTSFVLEFVHRQSAKKTTNAGPAITVEQKFKNLRYDLFTTLTILTPSRLKPLQLRKQLRNYQFQKIERKIQSQSLQKFGKAEQQLFKQQQNLILILTSVMKEFRSSKDNYFYILTKKSSRVFLFHHDISQKTQAIQSKLTICNLSQKMANQLEAEKIPFETKESDSYEKIIIKNQAISIFWGRIINKIIANEKHYKSFYILTSFPFPGGFQILPTQLFNGIQNKKQYSYIAKPQTNIIGQTLQQVYKLKITGLWTLQNIKNVATTMAELFGQKYFDIQFETERVTQYLKEEEDKDKEENFKN